MIETEQKLYTDDLTNINNFIEAFINADKAIEDFHNTKYIRGKERLKECLYMGKGAEQAFCNMFYNYNNDLVPNYEIHQGRNTGDGGKDILGTALKLDIKATRENSKWLLVDSIHLDDTTLYVVALERDKHVYKFAGYISGKEFKDRLNRYWFEYKPGSKLYNMNWIRQSDFPNYKRIEELYDDRNTDRINVPMNGHMIGFPIEYLRKDWKALGTFLLEESKGEENER